jgi:hypothetical protein
LAADAPVLDVLQPVVIDLFPALGEEPDEPVADGVTGLDGLWIPEKPLFAQAGLDRDIRPLAESDVVLVGLLLRQETEFLEALDRLHASLEAVESGKTLPREVIERAIGIHDVDDGKVVPQADLVVGFVMGGSDLQHAGAELKVDRIVTNDR